MKMKTKDAIFDAIGIFGLELCIADTYWFFSSGYIVYGCIMLAVTSFLAGGWFALVLRSKGL